MLICMQHILISSGIHSLVVKESMSLVLLICKCKYRIKCSSFIRQNVQAKWGENRRKLENFQTVMCLTPHTEGKEEILDHNFRELLSQSPLSENSSISQEWIYISTPALSSYGIMHYDKQGPKANTAVNFRVQMWAMSIMFPVAWGLQDYCFKGKYMRNVLCCTSGMHEVEMDTGGEKSVSFLSEEGEK